MKNIPLLIGTIVGTIVLIIVIAFMFSGEPAEQIAADPTSLTEGARHAYGAEAPLVTVVEFSDLQCPACRAAQPLIATLKEQYADQVQIVFRHFPLDNIHPNARLAAVATEVAAESGLFWEYHDILFERQDEWGEISSRADVVNAFAAYAAELEIDTEQFTERIEDAGLAQAVEQDRQLGISLQVNATPTFFVNGVQTPAPQLVSAVESALASSATGTVEVETLESDEPVQE